MPAGIRIWNADGTLQFDTTNRLFRMLTLVDTNAVNGSTNLTYTGTLSVVVQPGNAENIQPDVSVSGSTVSWTYSGTGTKDTSRLLIAEY